MWRISKLARLKYDVILQIVAFTTTLPRGVGLVSSMACVSDGGGRVSLVVPGLVVLAAPLSVCD